MRKDNPIIIFRHFLLFTFAIAVASALNFTLEPIKSKVRMRLLQNGKI